MVQPARLELAQEKSHYPLKVACLPIPPWLHGFLLDVFIIAVKLSPVKIFFVNSLNFLIFYAESRC